MKMFEDAECLQLIDENLLDQIFGGGVCVCAGGARPNVVQAQDALKNGLFNSFGWYGSEDMVTSVVVNGHGQWRDQHPVYYRPGLGDNAHNSEMACRQFCTTSGNNMLSCHFWVE